MTSTDGRKSHLSELACHKMIAIGFNKTILAKIEFGRRTQYIKNFISKIDLDVLSNDDVVL